MKKLNNRGAHGEPTGLASIKQPGLVEGMAVHPNPHGIDLKNFENMEDMDEDSRLAAMMQAEEMMNSMQNQKPNWQ